MLAALIISHGSRYASTKQEIVRLIDRLSLRKMVDFMDCAFLEIESPNIPEGIARCINKGATKVIVVLNFLNSGRHVDEDIPKIVHDAQRQFPHISIVMTKPIGQHPGIDDLFVDLIRSS